MCIKVEKSINNIPFFFFYAQNKAFCVNPNEKLTKKLYNTTQVAAMPSLVGYYDIGIKGRYNKRIKSN